ncbi:hypothetical protein [Brevibacterium sandarakinum]|uniref:hypothetical protein n=1 Tax=Brevibacterium sandarakinum TaxID=629680 RepID=UPI0012FDB68D|nr:hypothetical protein [Brevibacterium sandarakinum]
MDMYFYVQWWKVSPSPRWSRAGGRGQIGLLGHANETDFIQPAEVRIGSAT